MIRFLIAFLLFLPISAWAGQGMYPVPMVYQGGGSTPVEVASDGFGSYSHATSLATTADWTGLTGTLLCLETNYLRGNVNAGFSAAYWSADSYSADQYSEATVIGTNGGAVYGGALVRGGLSGSSNPQFYAVATNISTTIKLYSYDGDDTGSEVTEIASYSQAISSGGKVKIEVTGTGASIRLAVYYDSDGASGWTLLASDIDPVDHFDSGSAGVAYWGNTDVAKLTAWAGGTL